MENQIILFAYDYYELEEDTIIIGQTYIQHYNYSITLNNN